MRVFKFPFALRSDDVGNYLLDCDSIDTANALVSSAEDDGYISGDFTVVVTSTDDLSLYDALSTTRYPSLGYSTKEELLAAYDKVIGDKEVTAYSIDNVESAVIGVTADLTRFVYDYDLIIEALMDDETDETSAIEWYEYNIVRSFPYYQPSPIVVHCVTNS